MKISNECTEIGMFILEQSFDIAFTLTACFTIILFFVFYPWSERFVDFLEKIEYHKMKKDELKTMRKELYKKDDE